MPIPQGPWPHDFYKSNNYSGVILTKNSEVDRTKKIGVLDVAGDTWEMVCFAGFSKKEKDKVTRILEEHLADFGLSINDYFKFREGSKNCRVIVANVVNG